MLWGYRAAGISDLERCPSELQEQAAGRRGRDARLQNRRAQKDESVLSPESSALRASGTGPDSLSPQHSVLSPEFSPQSSVVSSVLSDLSRISSELTGCTRCRLHSGRTNLVFGEGSAESRLVFIGEGPGFEEDRQGRPFVGRAGKLLDKMILAIGFAREDVYICNIVKCRPPENRTPLPDEAAVCSPFLFRQIQALSPEGRFAPWA